MPGRDYFSLRYAVPGFSFILIIVGLNFLPIQMIIAATGANDVFGVVLSFISLFASSAIGFLVTQVWFAHFHGMQSYAKLFREVEPLMKKKFNWNPESKGKNKEVILSTILDYMLISEKKNNEQKWGYFQRKWDIFHIISGTMCSLPIALLIGLGLRIICNCFFFGQLPFDSFSNGFNTFLGNNISSISEATNSEVAKLGILVTTDVWLFLLTIIITTVAIIPILYCVREHVFDNYLQMLRIFIFEKAEKDKSFVKRIRSVFGNEYFSELTD